MFGIDDALLAAGGSALGSMAGGLFGYLGQSEANWMNQASAREMMAFQERMANTSWQRGVADMKAAGINPMAAFMKGGAPAPAGASSSAQNAGQYIGQGVSSAFQMAQRNLEMQKMAADTAYTQSAARKMSYDADNASRYAPLNKAIGDAIQKVIEHLGLGNPLHNPGNTSGVTSGRGLMEFLTKNPRSLRDVVNSQQLTIS